MNKKHIKTISALALGSALAFSAVAFAETGSSNTKPEPRKNVGELRQKTAEEIKSDREAFKDSRKEDLQNMRSEVKENRQEVKSKIEEARANGTLDQIKPEIKKMIEENKNIRQLTKEQIEKKREEFKASTTKKIAEFKEGKKVILENAQKERVKMILGKVFERFTGIISRLEAFDTRVADAIAKRKAKGQDTSASEKALEEARNALATAKTAVSAIKDASTAAVDSTTGVSKEALKEVMKDAHEAIKAAKNEYVEVIPLLPKIEVDDSNNDNDSDDNSNATSTATTTASTTTQ